MPLDDSAHTDIDIDILQISLVDINILQNPVIDIDVDIDIYRMAFSITIPIFIFLNFADIATIDINIWYSISK